MRRQKAYFIRLIAAGTAGAFCLMAFTGVTNSAFFLKTQKKSLTDRRERA